MLGHAAGDQFGVDVTAADAYGERRDGLSQRIPKKHFGAQKLEPGMQVVLQTNFGPRAVTIEKVGMSVVDVDLNHPMAGKDLEFDIEIVDVREATEEELAHGHVHGQGVAQVVGIHGAAAVDDGLEARHIGTRGAHMVHQAVHHGGCGKQRELAHAGG